VKIQKNAKIKKYAFVATIAVICLILIFTIYRYSDITKFFVGHNDKNPTIQTGIEQSVIDEQKKNDTKNQTINNDLGVTITNIDTSSSSVSIKSMISGAITNNGSCTLNLKNDNNTVTKTASTYALPSSSTCMGFTIDKGELSSGTWQVELAVTVNDKTSSATGSFSLE
jgi:hypothetical protein